MAVSDSEEISMQEKLENKKSTDTNDWQECHGCHMKFHINAIAKHVVHKPSCKNLWSEKQLADLQRICNSHNKRKKSQLNSAQYKKKQKTLEDPYIFQCKNPYCKSKRNRQKFNACSLLKHLASHEICEGYFASSEIQDLESRSVRQDSMIKSKIAANRTNIEDQGLKLDIYCDGLDLARKCDLKTQKKFYERIKEKDEICRRLYHSISNFTKSYDEDEIGWANNLIVVENSLKDLIYYQANQCRASWDIWTDELLKTMSKFYNKKDIEDDIWDVRFELKGYNDETVDHLYEEVKTVFEHYVPEDKSLAICFARNTDEIPVYDDVRRLLHYVFWCSKNTYDYCLQNTIILRDHIQWQLCITDFVQLQKNSILNNLKKPFPKEYNSSDWIDFDFDTVVCRGCPNNPHRFRHRTILKHLRHHTNKYCLSFYHNLEIDDMEKYSKLRKIITTKDWKQENEKHEQIYFKKRNLNDDIKEKILLLNKESVWSQGRLRKHLFKLQNKLLLKCSVEKDERYFQLSIDFEKLEKTCTCFFNEADVKENLSEWRKEIEDEISETFLHLEKQINLKYNFYTVDQYPQAGNPDGMVGYDFTYSGPKRSILSFQWDARELLHYITWRHENSYAMICEKTNLIAQNIKQQIEDESCFPIHIIRQIDISDFKMLSYDRVPGYDPSEGITVKGPKMIHPEDHPNYPHYCYFGFEAEYDTWFKQTSNSKFKFKEHFPLISDDKPTLCVNGKERKGPSNTIILFCQDRRIGICNLFCNFNENDLDYNCNFYPRCKGCKEIFSSFRPGFRYAPILSHLKKNPMCYSKYSKQDYERLEFEVNELKISYEGKQVCNGCSDTFGYWEILEHLDRNSSCFSTYSPEQYSVMRKQCNNSKKKLEAVRDGKEYCKGCSNAFEYSEIINHLWSNKDCKSKYSPEEIVSLKIRINYRKNYLNGTLKDQDEKVQKANQARLLKLLKMEREAEENEDVSYEIYDDVEYENILQQENL